MQETPIERLRNFLANAVTRGGGDFNILTVDYDAYGNAVTFSGTVKTPAGETIPVLWKADGSVHAQDETLYTLVVRKAPSAI